MARVVPFQPYRYAPSAGPLADLLTQPYDKITPAMRGRYLARSPFNLVRVILGEPAPEDTEQHNVYTRAAVHLEDWIRAGILARDPAPGFYAYSQEFRDPDSGEWLTRRGFIGLGQLEDYSAGVVHRHERTLTSPKQDRMELLRHTRAQCELLFLLYQDPELIIDRMLVDAGRTPPEVEVEDEYSVVHRIWPVAQPERVAAISRLMADRRLIIADGHHRYETAVAFRDRNPALAGARFVPMTFVNMHSPGLRILATHRVIGGLDSFDAALFLERARSRWRVTPLDSPETLRSVFLDRRPGVIRLGIALDASAGLHLLETDRAAGQLDVSFLHSEILDGMLGIGAEAVRDERYLRYARGIDAALDQLAHPPAQIAFLLEPTTLDQVAEVSFSGGVMPQKSTDFYPKLLSGLAIHKMDC